MKRTLIMALIILAACRKSTTGKEVEDTSLPSTASVVDMTKKPANALNIYDSAGMNHNDVLWYIHQHLGGNNHPAHQLVTQLVIQYAIEHGTVLSPSYFSTVEHTVGDEANLFANVVNNISYSDQVKTALKNLLNIVSAQCANKTVSYDQIKQAIVNYEDGILQNNVFRPDEKQIILKASSVARYSAYYWMEVDPRAVQLKDLRLLWWIAAITSDIAGVVVSGNCEYAADCSKYAFDLLTYSLPG